MISTLSPGRVEVVAYVLCGAGKWHQAIILFHIDIESVRYLD